MAKAKKNNNRELYEKILHSESSKELESIKILNDGYPFCKYGAINVDKIYYGNIEVTGIYYGSTKIL